MLKSFDLAAFNVSAETLRHCVKRHDRRRLDIPLSFYAHELVCWQSHVLVAPEIACQLTRSIISRLAGFCKEEARRVASWRARAGSSVYIPTVEMAAINALNAECAILLWQREWRDKLLAARADDIKRASILGSEVQKAPSVRQQSSNVHP